MIIIDHAIAEDTGNGAQISFDIVGSVGNIYKVWIKASPSCTCPDHMYRRNRCKHIAYVMLNALSGTDEQIAQRFFYREDLNHMRESPALKRFEAAKAAQNPQGTRRPVEGECAICFMGMEETEEIVWCQYGCGNNLHGFCMNKWSKSSGGNVRCVYCRALWDAEKKNPQADAIRNAGVRRGMYVNVAEQFGMTGSSGMYLSIFIVPGAITYTLYLPERKVSPGKLRATESREADSNEELDGDAM
ncbi:unnamed protein product [Penicillium salamii]|nr:unnamed protein product [Penicillium salamii]